MPFYWLTRYKNICIFIPYNYPIFNFLTRIYLATIQKYWTKFTDLIFSRILKVFNLFTINFQGFVILYNSEKPDIGQRLYKQNCVVTNSGYKATVVRWIYVLVHVALTLGTSPDTVTYNQDDEHTKVDLVPVWLTWLSQNMSNTYGSTAGQSLLIPQRYLHNYTSVPSLKDTWR